MNTESKNTLKNLATTLGSIVAVCTGLWFLGEDSFNKKLDDRFYENIKSPEVQLLMQVKAEEEKRKYEAEIEKRASHSVGFRELVGIKLEVPKDEAHIEIGNLKKRITELERALSNEKDLRKRLHTPTF